MTDINTEAQFGPREIIPFTDAQWEARAEAQERGHIANPDHEDQRSGTPRHPVAPALLGSASQASGQVKRGEPRPCAPVPSTSRGGSQESSRDGDSSSTAHRTSQPPHAPAHGSAGYVEDRDFLPLAGDANRAPASLSHRTPGSREPSSRESAPATPNPSHPDFDFSSSTKYSRDGVPCGPQDCGAGPEGCHRPLDQPCCRDGETEGA